MKPLALIVILSAVTVSTSRAFEWEYLGMAGIPTTCIEVDPIRDRIFVGTQEGFHYYDEASGTWTERDEEGAIGRAVFAIQWLPALSQRVITGRENAFFKGYLELSDDLGATGNPVWTSPGGRFVDIMNDGDRLYACGISDITPGELVCSLTDGLSWYPITGHGQTTMTSLAAGLSGEIYVGGEGPVSLSWDNGSNWEPIGAGLPALLVNCLQPLPVTGDVVETGLYVGNDAGLYRGSWPQWEWEQVLPHSCRRLTVAFVLAPWPLTQVSRVVCLTVDGRVFMSDPGGSMWEDVTGDLPATGVDIAFSPRDKGLYIATADDGVYRTQHVITAAEPAPRPQPLELLASPNPFNPRVKLRFVLLRDARAYLSICDASGRRVAVLCDRRLAAGEHVLTWQANGQASGMYMARLIADRKTATKQVLLIR
jgi:hypothetical protein